MIEQSQNSGTAVEERRSQSDRRTHRHDELFQYAVNTGYFLEQRRGERRAAAVES